jgi:V/A-type H+-transporting ATPase subunit D
MAIVDNIKPTRSELLEIRKRIRLSESGYKLLKMKRDGLIIEFFKILDKAKDIRGQLVQDLKTAERAIALARSVDGAVTVKSAALALKDQPNIMLRSRNVMGIVVPIIDSRRVRKRAHERGYGIIGTSIRIDEAAEAYERLVERIILAAEIETTMRRLLDEIEKTKRRVNALEFKVIPELKDAARFVVFRLEEMERDNIFRLKRIKKKAEREAAEEEAAAAAPPSGGPGAGDGAIKKRPPWLDGLSPEESRSEHADL